MIGTIINLMPNRGFGFIRGSDNLTYFVHAKNMLPDRQAFDTLYEGKGVEFTPSTYEGKRRAVEVSVVGGN